MAVANCFCSSSNYNCIFGKGVKDAILTIARQGIYYFPVIFILPIFLGLNGVILAQSTADVLAAITALIMSLSVKKDLTNF